MVNRQQPRGPDARGFHNQGPTTLGMCRLAIIDPAQGHQPMVSSDERFSLIFNGTIYNYQELQAELAARGWIFKTKSDTEVLLAAYALDGAACLGTLRGMYAFAIWDAPLFFRQTRVGKNRLLFDIVKLRTMRVSPGGDAYTRVADQRITRVGRFLRNTRLDEVPQLWNVLRGDMSLIGPRAEWVRLVNNYEQQIPCYHFRHLVKPGITGWAQVSYNYGENIEDTLRKLEYDLYYIRYFSFVLDASIILKTIHLMLFGKGR